MLTSSDAKWRCLWHMLVWSLLLTLVSQFLQSQSHVAFYILAGFSLVGLPVLTAVYSNTAGKHGASLLRAGYVFGDPVIACLTLTPSLLFTKLPQVVSEHLHTIHCTDDNISSLCLSNSSNTLLRSEDLTLNRDELIEKQRKCLAIIQASVVVPPLISLLMGPRTHKMRLPTYLLSFLYWLVTSVEAVDLIDYTLINADYQHIIYTTETIVTIVKTITHSYAVVTLCSFITPAHSQRHKKHAYSAKFELLYQAFVIISGTLFTELPLVVARLCIMSVDFNRLLPSQFYVWLVKDFLVIVVLIILLISQRIGARKNNAFPCKLHLDTPNVFFQPEKRDEYIVKKKVRFQEPLVSADSNHVGAGVDLLTVCLSSVDTASALSVSHESGMELLGFSQHTSETRLMKMASAPSLSLT